jgi:Fe-S cluster assembly protein SufD
MSAPRESALLRALDRRPRTAAPPWLAERRERATASLRTSALPTRKTEAWRFTPIGPVIETAFEPAPAGANEAARWADAELGDDGTWRIALVNGRPALDLTAPPPAGVTVESLADALARTPQAIEPYLGAHGPQEHFAALNAALFEDGLVLRIGKDAAPDRPVHVAYVGAPGASPTAAYPRVLVIAEPGATVTLIESFLLQPGERHLTNAVTEVYVGANAEVDHTRVQHGAANGYVIGQLVPHQQQGSRYRSRAVTFGGALYRLDLHSVFAGEGAECLLDGAYHAASGDCVDHHTFIDHAVPRCSSKERYRGILDGTGRAVFDGTIAVRRDAQQTDAHQENRNLLLSDDAIVHTKPHLEIDADEVSCSHGATIGALDADQLFYLCARGIDRGQAEAILTFAFARAVIDDIPHAPLAARLADRLRQRLPHGDSVQELTT